MAPTYNPGIQESGQSSRTGTGGWSLRQVIKTAHDGCKPHQVCCLFMRLKLVAYRKLPFVKSVCVHVCECTHVHAYQRAHVCMNKCVCACMCVHTCSCTCDYVCVCAHVQETWKSLCSQVSRSEIWNVKHTGLFLQGEECNTCYPLRMLGVAFLLAW